MISADLTYDLPQAADPLLGVFLLFGIWFRLNRSREELFSQGFQAEILKRLMVPRSSINFWGKNTRLVLCMDPCGAGLDGAERQRKVSSRRRAGEVRYPAEIA